MNSLQKLFKDIILGEKASLVIAHRGYSDKYPENTIPSFQAALNLGADMIELDVYLSSDNQLVVIHDHSLSKTTNGSGYVWDHTLSELKKLDAGSWFSSKFKNIQIPSLQEVLDIFANKILINIEIKYRKSWNLKGYDIEKEIVDIIVKNDLISSIIISSFEYHILENIRKLNKDINLAYLSDKQEKTTEIIKKCRKINAIAYNPNYRFITNEKIEGLHKEGLAVLPWAVAKDNNKETMDKTLSIGADGFFANNPQILKDLIG